MNSVTLPRETNERVEVIYKLDGVQITSGVQTCAVIADARPTTWTAAELISGKTYIRVNAWPRGKYIIYGRAVVGDETPVEEAIKTIIVK